MSYYSNSTSSFQILLRSGDIAQNPGPARCGLGKQGSVSKQRTTVSQSVGKDKVHREMNLFRGAQEKIAMDR